MKFRLSNLKRRLVTRRAWTLPEMMISVAIGTLILGSVGSVYIFMNRTLDATINYEELDRQSRNALDLMTADIRQCGHLTNYSTTELDFTNLDGTALWFKWDGSNLVTYSNASSAPGCPRGGVLLKGCNNLKFSIFQRNPSNGTTMTFIPAPTNQPNLTKVIVMDWICRRTNYVSLTDSESVQTAKVVMRN